MRFGLSTRRAVAVGVAAVAVVAIAVASVWALSGTSTATTAKVTTASVKRGDITVTASAAGTVQPVNSRALTFGTSGTLATLTVKAGDHVTEDEVLATIDPTDAQAAVVAAQSALDAANTNLALARQQAESPTPTPTNTCQGVVDDPAVAMHPPTPTPTPTPSPTVTTSPTKPSSPAKPSSPIKPSSPTKTHSQSPTCTSRGGGGGGQGQNGQTSTGTDNLLRAEQSVNNDQLALDQAEDKLAGTTITAPIAGRVLSVAGAVGANVQAGGSGFIVLGGLNSLAIQASFSEADVAAVKIGQKATVTLADHPGTTYQATVDQIDPAGTASGSLVKYGVQLAFVSVPADLLLGQTADVAVTTASVANVLYVPTAAIATAADGSSTVTVRTATGDVVRTVMTGMSGDQGTEITSGLTEGDVVVTSAH